VDNKDQMTYFTAMTFPDKDAVRTFESNVRASGWYDYFDRTNSSGPMDTFANVMGHSMPAVKTQNMLVPRSQEVDEPTCKRGSVPTCVGGDHPSATVVANGLMRPTSRH
jgi:hypothetical protein